MGEGGDLDNQQEFWVNKTHIAKIAAKAKNWLESKYWVGVGDVLSL